MRKSGPKEATRNSARYVSQTSLHGVIVGGDRSGERGRQPGRGELMMSPPPPPHPLLYEPITRRADVSDLRLVLRVLLAPREEEGGAGGPCEKGLHRVSPPSP